MVMVSHSIVVVEPLLALPILHTYILHVNKV